MPPAAPCSVSVTLQPPSGALYAACAVSDKPRLLPTGSMETNDPVCEADRVEVAVGVTLGVGVEERDTDHACD